MAHNIFFIQKQNGKGKSLFTVPGQKLNSRTALIEDCMTHGCEGIRKKYPIDTVFFAVSSDVKFKNGCYFTKSLTPLMLPNGVYPEHNIFTDGVAAEYRQLTEQTTTKIRK